MDIKADIMKKLRSSVKFYLHKRAINGILT